MESSIKTRSSRTSFKALTKIAAVLQVYELFAMNMPPGSRLPSVYSPENAHIVALMDSASKY
jgi:hypothetical protein